MNLIKIHNAIQKVISLKRLSRDETFSSHSVAIKQHSKKNNFSLPSSPYHDGSLLIIISSSVANAQEKLKISRSNEQPA